MQIALIAVIAIALAGCTVIRLNFEPGIDGEEPPAVNIQTSNSTAVLSAQNLQKDDKAGRGDLNSTKGDSPQKATSVPVIPITAPVSFP